MLTPLVVLACITLPFTQKSLVAFTKVPTRKFNLSETLIPPSEERAAWNSFQSPDPQHPNSVPHAIIWHWLDCQVYC